ncbi:hypothetical protein ACIQ2D_20800 [Lysinibacillus sp. NPDC097287]|uniref:hypothetical protein n=1 Tax=Lysinibacillus sp. NPDC097287 TaxID=3364144 RepID=UPI00381B1AC9
MNKASSSHSKIVGINKRLGVYRYYCKRVSATETLPNGKNHIVDKIMIMLEQKKSGYAVSVIHPISEFIHLPLKKGGIPSLKTQEQIANSIVNFLNFVFIEGQTKYKLSSIKDLLFEHGEDYLNVYGLVGRNNAPVKKETVKRCEWNLTRFYYFLVQKNILNYITIDDFDLKEYNNDALEVKRKPESPFINVNYPNDEEQENLIHDLPRELIIPFIQTAYTYTPRIALGVAFQCFGGLRVGEVVNIARTGITPSGEFGLYGFQIKIQNRDFRPELKNIKGKGTVKKRRRQGVFPFNGDLLQLLYKTHIEKYKAIDGTNALFSNRDGKAMEKFTYQREFRKLKNKFLTLLLESKDPLLRTYGLELSSAKWSTHIGRGIFSNLIAAEATNVLQVMTARGDDDPTSSIRYLNNTDRMLRLLKGNYDDMYMSLLEVKEEVISELKLNSRNRKKDD